MATTPNYGWVTPAPTDFVTDLPADFEIFADAVDASFAADEGDLLVGGTSNIFEPLPIGAAGTVLTSDGDTAEWVAPTAIVPSFSLLNAGGTALTGASTITVSGISGVNFLMILINGLQATSASQLVTIRFNADTGNNYTHLGPVYNSASTYAAANLSRAGDFDTDKLRCATTSTNTASSMDIGMFVQGANTAGVKIVQTSAGAQANTGTGHTMSVRNGYYKGTSTISSVSVLTDSNFTGGTMYVYGA
jgi:hypothetical protein